VQKVSTSNQVRITWWVNSLHSGPSVNLFINYFAHSTLQNAPIGFKSI